MSITITVHYMDGSRMSFTVERVREADWTISYLDKAISLRTIALQLEDRVVVIPSTSVKYIEISPPPDKLPAYVIRDAQFATAESAHPSRV